MDFIVRTISIIIVWAFVTPKMARWPSVIYKTAFAVCVLAGGLQLTLAELNPTQSRLPDLL